MTLEKLQVVVQHVELAEQLSHQHQADPACMFGFDPLAYDFDRTWPAKGCSE
jgi:hypothetical protein